MVLYPNKLPESERVCSGICTNGVPIETVSSMLGHKSIKTTQIYAKITKEKLNQDMENLAARLNNVEEFAGCTI